MGPSLYPRKKAMCTLEESRSISSRAGQVRAAPGYRLLLPLAYSVQQCLKTTPKAEISAFRLTNRTATLT